MRLDRDTNRGGRGKYALVNMRKLIPLLDRKFDPTKPDDVRDEFAVAAFNLLVSKGIITLGNEAPSQQFFVVKYGDKFTLDALRGYAEGITREIAANPDAAQKASLREYYDSVKGMILEAAGVQTKIPD